MARRAVEQHLDLDAVRSLASGASELNVPGMGEALGAAAGVAAVGEVSGAAPAPATPPSAPARVGVFRDAAFQFYYSHNLEALEAQGAEIVEISPLVDPILPPVDALYIGGGFPESFAATLAENRAFRESVRRAVEDGLPVYAECGGAVYLGRELLLEGVTYPMAGAIPAVFGFQEKPQGHGYVEMEAVKPNPFYPEGETVRGHEFHYTFAKAVIAENVTFAFRVHRGTGFGAERDGLCHRNVLACYTHVHALGVPGWAPALVRAAREGAPVAMAETAPGEEA
jgi:cobyrinic acid a,c-diamide synthase